MHNKNELLPCLVPLPTMRRIAVINVDQESFSYEEEHHSERQCKSPIHRGLGNDAMSKVLNQIAKSPFTIRIESIAPSQCFH